MTDSRIGDTTPTNTPTPPAHATLWRLSTIICVVLLAIAAATGMSMLEQFKAQIGHLQTKLKSVPQIKYIAVLQDDKHLPAQLVTFDPQEGHVQIQRLNDVKEGPNDSMQLWALDDGGRALSLGVITPRLKTAQLPATDNILSQAKALAVSVENKGGVEPTAQPRLPYLFSGVLIQKAL
ncbi:MAG: anti-sigma factor [Rhodoferax sp.]|nr:anti-sigma factor [Rhodoferax sp.]